MSSSSRKDTAPESLPFYALIRRDRRSFTGFAAQNAEIKPNPFHLVHLRKEGTHLGACRTPLCQDSCHLKGGFEGDPPGGLPRRRN